MYSCGWRIKAFSEPWSFVFLICWSLSTCLYGKLFQSSLTLCDPMDCSPKGSSVWGNSPDKNTGWIAMPSSRGFPVPGIEPESLTSTALAGSFFTINTTWETSLQKQLLVSILLPLCLSRCKEALLRCNSISHKKWMHWVRREVLYIQTAKCLLLLLWMWLHSHWAIICI